MTGAGTATLTKGCDFAGAAVAVDGLPAIAATTIKTMIAEPRFPDVFLAMSLSLSPHVSTYVKWILRDHFVWLERGLRPPSGGGNGANSLDRGISDVRSTHSKQGDRISYARK